MRAPSPRRRGRVRARRPAGAPMAKKILALVSEPVSADVLRTAVGGVDANDAEVLVVAPALMT